ncbi:MAG: hypothetical protein KF861_22075, partial [Planctomycetaceae bacterium]|nr:hypothetical protein [Planctomycetaceae bacterium]
MGIISELKMALANQSSPSRRRRRQRGESIGRGGLESLESRELLAGVVEGQSTFDLEQFAANIEEQAGTGAAGGLNVIGYTYAISQRDADNPYGVFEYLEDGDGFARMWWDGANDAAVLSDPSQAQESASLVKTITAAAVLKLLQDQPGSVV